MLCLCAPTCVEYSEGVFLALQQNSPLARPLIAIVTDYAQMETPLQEIAKTYRLIQEDKPLQMSVANIVRISSINIEVRLTENDMYTVFASIRPESQYADIVLYVSIRNMGSMDEYLNQINDVMQLCGYRASLQRGFIFVSMPCECTCGKWRKMCENKH